MSGKWSCGIVEKRYYLKPDSLDGGLTREGVYYLKHDSLDGGLTREGTSDSLDRALTRKGVYYKFEI